MTRAEKAAIEAYPRIIWYRMDKKPIDKNQTKRIGFIQGYEQAEKDIASIMADIFEYPCNYSPIDEEMVLSGNCEELCSSDEATAAKCWQRYFNLKRKK